MHKNATPEIIYWMKCRHLPFPFGEPVSKYAPQGLSNSNMTEEKVANLSMKYFKECLIPQSSQTFIFEQDEEATAVLMVLYHQYNEVVQPSSISAKGLIWT